jgi:hypothetical protein
VWHVLEDMLNVTVHVDGLTTGSAKALADYLK